MTHYTRTRARFNWLSSASQGFLLLYVVLPHLPTCNMQLGPSPSFLYNLHLCLLLSVPSTSPPLLSHLHCAVSTLFSSYIRSLTTTRLWLWYRFLREGEGGREMMYKVDDGNVSLTFTVCLSFT